MNTRTSNLVAMVLALTSSLLVSTAPAAVTTGLVAHWAFDDGSGTTVTDSTTTYDATTTTGTPTWGTGVIGGALDFDGTYTATAPAVGSDNLTTLTASTWVHPTDYASFQVSGAFQYGGLINKWSGNYAWALQNEKNANFDGAWTALGPDVPENDWTHVAVTYSGGTIKAYNNGLFVGSTSGNTLNSATPEFTIGGITSGGFRMFGLLDDAAVWETEKTDVELAAIHGLGLFSEVPLNDPAIDNVIAAFLAGPGNSALAGDDEWEFVSGLTGPTGTVGGIVDNFSAFIVLDGNLGTGVSLLAPVPEPSSLVLLGLGTLGLLSRTRRRKHHRQPVGIKEETNPRRGVTSSIKATVLALLVLLGAANCDSSQAALISLDFNTQNTVSPFEISPTMSGEEVAGVGTIFTGQTGVWNALLIGDDFVDASNVTNNTLTAPLATGSLFDGSGSSTDVVFTLGTDATIGTPFEYTAFNGAGTGSTDLRRDMIVLTGGRPGPAAWQISGLLPGESYNLVLFGQRFNNTAFNPADFTVFGGAPDLFDSQNDGNFLSVIANGSGVITGTMEFSGGTSSWSGLQIEGQFVPVPEPSSALLLGLGLFGLLRQVRRNRRNV